MRWTLLWCAAVAMLAGLSVGCQREPAFAAPLAALVEDLHARGLFDGAVAVSDGRAVFAAGYGQANRDRGEPFTPDTAADGASLAKTLTAALVIALASEGVLDLDAPVQRLLPELPYPGVTLRHLLTHTSGIPEQDYDAFDRDLPAGDVRETSTLLTALARRAPPLSSPPGTAFEYCSFGFDLAALAAARATGRSYAQLLDERFFTPLGITSAFVRPGRLADFPGARTLAYRRRGEVVEPHDVFDREAFHGGSNVYISARDLDRWNVGLMRGQVVTPAARDLLLQPAAITAGRSGLTLGSWYYAEGSAFWYSGHLQGFHSEVFRDHGAGHSIVYVSNNTLEPWLQKALVRAMRQVMRGEAPPPLTPPATQAVSDAQYGALVGCWALPSGTPLTIDQVGKALHVTRDAVRYRMMHVAPTAFYVPGLDLMLGVSDATAHAQTRLHVSSNVAEEWGARTACP